MVIAEESSRGTVVTLLPNRSMSWQETRLFLFLICGTTLAIGVFWALKGLWAILPFSGLEAGLLAWLMYRVSQNTYRRQVVTLAGDHVLVETGLRFSRRSWRLSRPDARLTVSEAPHPLAPAVLVISDREQRIELGEFLNKEDKVLALHTLRRAGLPVQSVYREGGRRM